MKQHRTTDALNFQPFQLNFVGYAFQVRSVNSEPPTTHAQFASAVRDLDGALRELETAADFLDVGPLTGREWFNLLRQKLIPQLTDDAFLVVAVVGGTNIGKSVIFNHIAGARASATSPLASGTKHPVCLVPPGFVDRHNLADIFQDFTLEQWSESDSALEERDQHTVFWRISDETADNLLVLDTPDIDSDAEVNWIRADAIRRSADVLIAVLTQQKYNDAAVKQFFRHAAQEDKVILIVFNQCLLPDDEQYWPVWLSTFCGETGIEPEFVYIAPNDRQAAEENRLRFMERPWPVPPDHDASPAAEPSTDGRDLAHDLSQLHFRDIKLQTLHGSLQHVLNSENGVPTYLAEIRGRSGEFATAAARFSSEGVVRVRNWPTIANSLLVAEIREWWRSRQHGWAKQVNSVYDAIGAGVAWPFRIARDYVQGPAESPIEQYRNLEWNAILTAVEEIFEKLTWMADSGNDLLRPRLEQLLAGRSRVELIESLKTAHALVDLERQVEETVQQEMQAFREGSPELFGFYRQLNNVGAAVRPVTSVVLFSMGAGPAGEAVAPFVADAAAQAIVPVVAGIAGGATTAVAGEAAVSGATGQSLGFLQARFHRLQMSFTESRVSWLVRLLKRDLLGNLPEQLESAAALPGTPVFQSVESHTERLRQLLADEQHADHAMSAPDVKQIPATEAPAESRPDDQQQKD